MTRSSNPTLDENARLMRRVAEDDLEAFESLYQRCAPALVRLFTKGLRSTSSGQGLDLDSAEDLVQKVFSSLWRQRKSFRGESSFETYLFSMAKRILNKELRQFRESAETNVKERSDFYSGLTQPEAEIYLQEMIDALEAAKAKLTAGQRQALDISQKGDVYLDKILEELGCSHKVYKSRLKRARKRLKELLAPFLEDER
ncbi:MAG: sigma-70 family RNA polymerase sigma factor [Sedimentisphaerales bacterium]|nr:sigma-70 family RNA polymerase sigma factor [Sedimentisphaerales bacterium]